MGSDFRKAYLPGVTLTGAGQTLGLLEFDGYYTNDIASYEVSNGLPNVPLTNVLVDGFSASPGEHNDEVSVDIEMCVAMKPLWAFKKIIVYQTAFSADDILNRMATRQPGQLNLARRGHGVAPARDTIADQIFSCSLPPKGSPLSIRPVTPMPTAAHSLFRRMIPI